MAKAQNSETRNTVKKNWEKTSKLDIIINPMKKIGTGSPQRRQRRETQKKTERAVGKERNTCLFSYEYVFTVVRTYSYSCARIHLRTYVFILACTYSYPYRYVLIVVCTRTHGNTRMHVFMLVCMCSYPYRYRMRLALYFDPPSIGYFTAELASVVLYTIVCVV